MRCFAPISLFEFHWNSRSVSALMATNDDLSLLCLWKIVHDAEFRNTINETIVAHISSSNTQNMQQLVR